MAAGCCRRARSTCRTSRRVAPPSAKAVRRSGRRTCRSIAACRPPNIPASCRMASTARSKQRYSSSISGFSRPTAGRFDWGSEPAVHHQALAADIVAVGAAEEIDRARRLFRQAAAAERDHLVHGGDAAALDSDLDLAALDLDLARLALAQGLGEAGLDIAEGHGIHRDVVAAELLGQRLGEADDARLAR